MFKDSNNRLAGFGRNTGRLLKQIADSSYDEGDQIDDNDDDLPASGTAAPSPIRKPNAPSGLPDNGFRGWRSSILLQERSC